MTYTKDQIKEILKKHLHWLREDCEGWEGMRADLSGADLRGADLRGADLSGADLSGADLRGADLRGAYLRRADLSGANLSRADLSGAYLRRAGLSGADLSGADLSGADLRRAYLRGADLSGAYLRGAYMSGAYLRGADLCGADLSGAKIELNFLNRFYPLVCPEYGSFIAWKKCANNTIVKLEVLEDAKRSSAYSRKCRCSAARVLAIENIDGTSYEKNSVSSQRDKTFIYTVGEIVKVDDFDEDRRNECSTGIHFFITRQEAVDW